MTSFAAKDLFTKVFFRYFGWYYDWLMTANYECRLREEFLEFVNPEPDSAAVEFGCGTGNFLKLLAKRCRIATGVDRSQAMLCRAQHCVNSEGLTNVQLIRSSLEEFECSVPFDIAVAVVFLYQFEDRLRVLNKMAACVKQGGIVATFDPSHLFTAGTVKHLVRTEHLSYKERYVLKDWLRAVRFYGPVKAENLRQQCQSAGLTIRRLEYHFEDTVLFMKAERQ